MHNHSPSSPSSAAETCPSKKTSLNVVEQSSHRVCTTHLVPSTPARSTNGRPTTPPHAYEEYEAWRVRNSPPNIKEQYHLAKRSRNEFELSRSIDGAQPAAWCATPQPTIDINRLGPGGIAQRAKRLHRARKLTFDDDDEEEPKVADVVLEGSSRSPRSVVAADCREVTTIEAEARCYDNDSPRHRDKMARKEE
ncbi:uncharacterized protein ACA1_071900 [Acanthamoeba castellanii str. Neff]|uniref:Uncharacterized protein n=1 Tax=Acanthamoeba castellanii (strain ATCC 30010 / Neff) TaxID=1257118 RepID=L8HFR6_ACACF|nr:uncharacterized protein ACA1_071900 [Acanthamoeba castellanii str. Neff]ELR23568.1 hypothetical protein ACA1_071900 [Acanthamoeba castellanii str. Neff]